MISTASNQARPVLWADLLRDRHAPQELSYLTPQALGRPAGMIKKSGVQPGGILVMSGLLQSVIFTIGILLLAPVVLVSVQRIRMRWNFDYAMKVVATEAVRRAHQEYQIFLDFSPASVQQLEEKILAKLHETHLTTPMSEPELSRASIRWGAYIGEVLKRARRGKWRRDSQQIGNGTMPVVFEPGIEAFPRSWVYKRIADGPEDNVAFKFQAFANLELRQHLFRRS